MLDMPANTRPYVLGASKMLFAHGRAVMVAKVEDNSVLPKRFALLSSNFGKFVARLYTVIEDIRNGKRGLRSFVDASKATEKKGWAEMITTNNEGDGFEFMAHFRLYRYSEEDEDYTPTTRGIALTMEEFGEFVANLEETYLKTAMVDNPREMELIKKCVDALAGRISTRGGPHSAHADFGFLEKRGDFKKLHSDIAKASAEDLLSYEEFIKHHRKTVRDATSARVLHKLDLEIVEDMGSSQDMFDFS